VSGKCVESVWEVHGKCAESVLDELVMRTRVHQGLVSNML